MTITRADILRLAEPQVDGVEVLFQDFKHLKFTYPAGTPQLSFTIDKGIRVRLIHQGNQSFTSYSLGRFGKNLLIQTINLLKKQAPIPAFRALADTMSSSVASISSSQSPLSSEEFESWLKWIYETLHDQYRLAAEIDVRGHILHQTRHFENSAQANIREESFLSFALVLLKSSHGPSYLLSLRPEVDLYKQISEQLYYSSFEQPTHVPPGEYSVVLGPKATWVLFHEIIGHQVEADAIINGSSLLGSFIGQKIASSDVTVVDDPFIMDFGGYHFDDEGIKGQGTLVIEDGILRDLLHSRETALLFGTESTGNFLSESFEHRPSVRQSNLFLEPKDWSHEELLQQVKNGLYINECEEGVSFSPDGSFNLIVRSGRKIVNGRLGPPFKKLVLNGSPNTVLGRILGISKHLRPWPAICVKNGQMRTVGAIAPAVAIEKMMVR